jgi:hypothetical protein
LGAPVPALDRVVGDPQQTRVLMNGLGVRPGGVEELLQIWLVPHLPAADRHRCGARSVLLAVAIAPVGPSRPVAGNRRLQEVLPGLLVRRGVDRRDARAALRPARGPPHERDRPDPVNGQRADEAVRRIPVERSLRGHDRLPAQLETIRVHSLCGHPVQVLAVQLALCVELPLDDAEELGSGRCGRSGHREGPRQQSQEHRDPDGHAQAAPLGWRGGRRFGCGRRSGGLGAGPG